MTEEPAWGIRRGEKGSQCSGQAGGREARGARVEEPHVSKATSRRWTTFARRSSPSTGPTSVFTTHVSLEVHGYGPAGGVLPRETGAPGRRRCARAFPDRWTRTQHRCPGRREPGMEAGPGGQRHIAGEPARYLPGRAAPDRRARARDHHGANGAHARRRTDEGLARDHVRAVEDGRASQAIRRDDVRSGHSLRSRR